MKCISFVAFDCDDEMVQHTSMSLVNEQKCQMERRNISTNQVTIQLLQSQTYHQLEVFNCYVTRSIQIIRCGQWMEGRNVVKKMYTVMVKLTRDECFELHKTNWYSDKLLTSIKFKLVDGFMQVSQVALGAVGHNEGCTGTYFRDDFGYEFTDVYVLSDTKVKIYTEQADLSWGDNTVKMASGVACVYQELQCANLEGQSFWLSVKSENQCIEKKMMVVFHGIATKIVEFEGQEKTISYSVSEGENVFIVESQKQVRICEMLAFESNHPLLYIIEEMPGYYFRLKMEDNINPKNIFMQLQFGLMLSRTYNIIGAQISDLYLEWKYLRCISDNKILANQIALLRLDPFENAQLLFENPGTISMIRGDLIVISRCVPKEVQIRNTDKCYKEIPAYLDQKEIFVKPNSRIIVKLGIEEVCSNLFQSTFKLDEVWIAFMQGIAHPVHQPEQLITNKRSTWKWNKIEGLAYKGIYSQDQVENFRKATVEARERKAIQANIIQAIEGKSKIFPGVSITNAFSINDLEKLKHSLFQSPFDWVWIKIEKIGTFFAGLLGMFFIFKCIKLIFNSLINLLMLKDTFGWTFKLIYCCWSNLAHYKVAKEQNREMTQRQVLSENMAAAKESNNIKIPNDEERQMTLNNEIQGNNIPIIPSQFESIHARMYPMVN